MHFNQSKADRLIAADIVANATTPDQFAKGIVEAYN